MTDDIVAHTESGDKDISVFAQGICLVLALRTGIPTVVHWSQKCHCYMNTTQSPVTGFHFQQITQYVATAWS